MGKLFRIWCVGSVIWAAPVFSRSGFLASEIQNKDAEGLRRELNTYGDSSAASEFEQGLRWLALGSLEWESGHPHAANQAWDRVEKFCGPWRQMRYEAFTGKDRARAAGLCALAGAERTAMESPAMVYRSAKRLQSDIQTFQLGDLDENEVMYLTGRLRSALSPAFGQDFKTALLSWRILERVEAGAPGLDYWTSLTLQRQGNRAGAQEAFAKALQRTPVDPRAAARGLRSRPQDAGEWDYGITPLFFTSPVRGVGFGVRAFDDRIADGGHALALSARGSTRGNFWADFHAQESQWTAPLEFSLAAQWTDRWRDFHGWGMASAVVPQSFRATEASAQAGLGWRWADWEISVGGVANTFATSTAPAGVSPEGYLGAWGQIEWDTRDRQLSARTGGHFLLRQEIDWRNSGGSFASTRGRLAGFHRLGVRHGVDWTLALHATSGAPPYNALVDLFDSQMPAVREFRFMESQGAAAWVKYHYLLLPWFRPGGFVVAGSVAPTVSALPGALQFGGGIEAEILLQRTPKAVPRWEFGYFGGIWIFQGGIRAAL